MNQVNRRQFMRLTGMGAAAFATQSMFTSCSAEKNLPNIIVILADDLGYGDVGCLNPDSKIPTPHLDTMADNGITFTDAHASSSLCSPTRYGLLTGRYSWRSRRQGGALWSFAPPLIEDERLTIGRYLKEHGYHTACIGKWHLGMNWVDKDGNILENTGAEKGWNIDFTQPLQNGPTTRGFDYFFGTDAPNYPPYCFIENDRTIGIPSISKPDSMYGVPGIMLEEWDLYNVLPEMEKKSLEYIDRRADSGQPFFLYFPLTAPHTPIAPTKEHRGKSEAGAYGDFVHQIDSIVGNILQTLEQKGIRENTLVIFTSDNGSPRMDGTDMAGKSDSILKYGHNPSYTFRGKKADFWEGGHRVPFIVSWPGQVKEGVISNEIVCLTDIFATVAAIVGEKLPDSAGEDSYNIWPVLYDEQYSAPIREATVHLSGDGSFAIRQGKWKMEIGSGSGGGSVAPEKAMQEGWPMIQLYNLEEDIGEQNNLYDRYPDVVYRLTRLLENYVNNGRSTPGRPQPNTGQPDIWRSLKVRDDKFQISNVAHLAVGKNIRSMNNAVPQFSQNGWNVLTDGIRASSLYSDGYWVGIEEDHLDIVIDLGKATNVTRVSAGFLEAQSHWIFYPLEVSVSTSVDGNGFKTKKRVSRKKLVMNEKRNIEDFSFALTNETCRYVRIQAKNVKTCPEWHKGAGGKAWLFIDEVMVQ